MYNIKFINEIFQHIWEDRYQKNGETLDGNIKRVAEYCAKDPDDAVKFSNIMKEGKFFPGGRTMSNAGIGKALTLNNCLDGETQIITKEGYKTLRELAGRDDIQVLSNGGWHNASVRSFGVQPVCEISIQRNAETKTLTATPDHIWYVVNQGSGSRS